MSRNSHLDPAEKPDFRVLNWPRLLDKLGYDLLELSNLDKPPADLSSNEPLYNSQELLDGLTNILMQEDKAPKDMLREFLEAIPRTCRGLVTEYHGYRISKMENARSKKAAEREKLVAGFVDRHVTSRGRLKTFPMPIVVELFRIYLSNNGLDPQAAERSTNALCKELQRQHKGYRTNAVGSVVRWARIRVTGFAEDEWERARFTEDGRPRVRYGEQESGVNEYKGLILSTIEWGLVEETSNMDDITHMSELHSLVKAIDTLTSNSSVTKDIAPRGLSTWITRTCNLNGYLGFNAPARRKRKGQPQITTSDRACVKPTPLGREVINAYDRMVKGGNADRATNLAKLRAIVESELDRDALPHPEPEKTAQNEAQADTEGETDPFEDLFG